MEIPRLDDLIRLFEDVPEGPDGGAVTWPFGLHSFALGRGSAGVLFSIDPAAGEAFVSLYADDAEIATLGNLCGLIRLSFDREDGREGLTIWLEDAGPIRLQTRPAIRLTWEFRRW
ncbi:hypothetical protein [Spongiactinospora sp. 9N601]|uniref:hypothetical protein n=1 Tax=Spongiactinospora sp. 9N601 TaxID=3375149 RepID=UPI00379C46C2